MTAVLTDRTSATSRTVRRRRGSCSKILSKTCHTLAIRTVARARWSFVIASGCQLGTTLAGLLARIHTAGVAGSNPAAPTIIIGDFGALFGASCSPRHFSIGAHAADLQRRRSADGLRALRIAQRRPQASMDTHIRAFDARMRLNLDRSAASGERCFYSMSTERQRRLRRHG